MVGPVERSTRRYDVVSDVGQLIPYTFIIIATAVAGTVAAELTRHLDANGWHSFFVEVEPAATGYAPHHVITERIGRPASDEVILASRFSEQWRRVHHHR